MLDLIKLTSWTIIYFTGTSLFVHIREKACGDKSESPREVKRGTQKRAGFLSFGVNWKETKEQRFSFRFHTYLLAEAARDSCREPNSE